MSALCYRYISLTCSFCNGLKFLLRCVETVYSAEVYKLRCAPANVRFLTYDTILYYNIRLLYANVMWTSKACIWLPLYEYMMREVRNLPLFSHKVREILMLISTGRMRQEIQNMKIFPTKIISDVW